MAMTVILKRQLNLMKEKKAKEITEFFFIFNQKIAIESFRHPLMNLNGADLAFLDVGPEIPD